MNRCKKLVFFLLPPLLFSARSTGPRPMSNTSLPGHLCSPSMMRVWTDPWPIWARTGKRDPLHLGVGTGNETSGIQIKQGIDKAIGRLSESVTIYYDFFQRTRELLGYFFAKLLSAVFWARPITDSTRTGTMQQALKESPAERHWNQPVKRCECSGVLECYSMLLCPNKQARKLNEQVSKTFAQFQWCFGRLYSSDILGMAWGVAQRQREGDPAHEPLKGLMSLGVQMDFEFPYFRSWTSCFFFWVEKL